MKYHDELTRQFSLLGIRVTGMEQRKKSMAYTLSRGKATVKYYTGVTPSDYRAIRNAVADVDRLLRTKEQA